MKIWSPLLYLRFGNTFCLQNLEYYGLLHRYHCKNTLYYHLSMACKINVQRDALFAASEIYVNLSLKSLMLILSFFILKFKLNSWVSPPFFSENLSPSLVSPPQNFLWFPLFWNQNLGSPFCTPRAHYDLCLALQLISPKF